VQKELVATVSHELRTPIAAIKGFAETLLGGALDDPQWNREFTATILRHSDRLTRLVDDLLAFSLLESGRRKPQAEPVDLSRLVWDFIAGMEPVARSRRQKLAARMPKELKVCVDPTQITQVLQNLVDNACKFGRSGDTVRIEAGRVEGFALLKVVDAGPGIPPEEAQRIFEPFHRIDDARKQKPGAGLGLAIARRIVESHGGRIWAERRPQGGSVFAFTLPLA
jgi:two-component system, OmpR family, phosphate regulon sensor histidine kinase PhoR